MASVFSEDLNKFFPEFVKDIIGLAGSVDLEVTDPEYVVDKGEEFIKVLWVVSALSDEDIDEATPVQHLKHKTRAHGMWHTE